MLLLQLDRRSATLFRLGGLALITWTVINTKHAPASSGRGLVVLTALILAIIAWLIWTFWTSRRTTITPDVWVLAICGGVLAAAAPNSAGAAFAFVAATSASVRCGIAQGLLTVTLGALAIGIGAIVYDNSGLGVLAYTLGWTALALGGTNIRQIRLRADQAELLLAQTQRSHEEQMRAARLEEQARIARDIHDVLAHSLAGLTIQLEATTALLDQGADPQSIRDRVSRAHELARDGLRETRRAVGALRGEETTQVPLALRAAVEDYRAEVQEPVDLAVSGDQAVLTGQIGEAVLRTVQEAITNVRKHAPGAALSVSIDAGPDNVTVVVIPWPLAPGD